jgi:hypothetical protein
MGDYRIFELRDSSWQTRRCAMADDEALKPADFPVHTDQKQIVKNDGKAIAKAHTKKTAEDIAERLNAEEDRREEDRWSA